jgi:hypothetical protein
VRTVMPFSPEVQSSTSSRPWISAPSFFRVLHDAALGEKETTVLLVKCEIVFWKLVSGEAAGELGAGEHFVRQVVKLARFERAREDNAVRLTGIDGAGDVQEMFSTGGFQFAPELVGAR